MKLGINTYSYLWSSSLEDSVKELADNGFKALEFIVSPPQFYLNEYRPGMYANIKSILEKNNIEVLSLNIPGLDINIASPYPEMRKMTVDLYKKTVDVSRELGAKILVVVPGKRHTLLPPDFEYVYGLAKDTVKQILDYMSNTDMILGIETVPAMFMDKVSDIKRLLNDIGSKQVKIVYDVANVFIQEDPAEGLQSVKDDICLVHLSDTRKSRWLHSIIGSGEVDFTSIFKSLNAIDYQGYTVLEIINDKGVMGINESIANLKKLGWEWND